jgi:hypothetical protein
LSEQFSQGGKGQAVRMEMRVLPLSSSQNYLPPRFGSNNALFKPNFNSLNSEKVYASKEGKNGSTKGEAKQSLFTNLTDALDFAQVRSEEDAELLYEAREATKAGGMMTRVQVIWILINHTNTSLIIRICTLFYFVSN